MAGTQLNPADYVQSNKAELVLLADLAEANRLIVNGLNNMEPPRTERGTGTAEQFDRKSANYNTTLNNIMSTASGNYVKDDDGQELLEQYKTNDTQGITNIWEYLVKDQADPTNDIIIIPDAVNDPTGKVLVSQAAVGGADNNSHWPWNTQIQFNILTIRATHQLLDAAIPGITFVAGAGSGDSIVDSNNGLEIFEPGDFIYIDDLAGISGGISNAGKIVEVASVTAGGGSLTTVEDGYLTTDATGASTVVLRGGKRQ